jgi:hypothetical protein
LLARNLFVAAAWIRAIGKIIFEALMRKPLSKILRLANNRSA